MLFSADNVKLFMEEREELTLDEDWAAPLVTEVSPYFSFMICSLDHFIFLSSILLNPSSHLQTLQKIHLANHIRHMADLLQANLVQQLEVALLGSPAAQAVDLLSRRLVAQTKSSTLAIPAQPQPRIYTSTPPVPPPSFVPIVGLLTTSQIPAVVVPALESTSGVDESALPKTKVSKISDDFQCCHITPTLVDLSSSTSTLSSSTSAVAYPELISRPCGDKDYLCHLCPFRHSNLDSILTLVRKHLEIIIGCPICSRGYQNAASLCKHGRDAHSIQIVTSTTSLPGVISKEQI